jgi:hypothetical protein
LVVDPFKNIAEFPVLGAQFVALVLGSSRTRSKFPVAVEVLVRGSFYHEGVVGLGLLGAGAKPGDLGAEFDQFHGVTLTGLNARSVQVKA